MSNQSQTNNAVQQMAEKIMPGLQTDHGGINLGDIVVLLISSVLLIYTGYRSWHFLSLSIPEDFQILALVGLWGIDIAMVGWAVVWIFGSSSPGQDGVSMAMWVIDVIAMILTSVIDTIMYADGSAIPEIFKTIAWYGVPLIIVGNAVMAVIYHFTSPATKHRRQERNLKAKLLDAQQKGDFEIEEMTATANMLQDYTIKRANALQTISSVVDQNMSLLDIEQTALNRLSQAGLGHLLGSTASPPSPARSNGMDEVNDKIVQMKQSLKQTDRNVENADRLSTKDGGRSEFALPCGHTQGAKWDKAKQSYVCQVCDEPWDPNEGTPDARDSQKMVPVPKTQQAFDPERSGINLPSNNGYHPKYKA